MRKGNLRKGNLRKGQNALVHLHRGPSISQRALEATLKTVREHGVPEYSSRRSQFRARAEAVRQETPYGPVLKALHLGAESPDIYISHPLALLYRTAKECEPFRRVLQNALRKRPCSVSNPWRVVIYFDEITPTDPCSSKVDKHKIQGFYWTFMELADIKFDDKIWFVVSCSQSVQAAKLEAGMSQLVKHVLRKCFFDTEGFNLETSGIFLDESAGMDVPVRLFARHARTICDFNALKELLQSMGPSGLKPCPSCSNVVKDDLAVHGGSLVPLSSLDPDTWKRHTDKSVVALQDYLRAQKPLISAAAFAELESRSGYNYLPSSILVDRELNYKAMSTLRYDWVHCYFITGIFGRELEAFVDKARQCSPKGRPSLISYLDFHAYMSSWTCPAHWSSCKHIFEKGHMAATASDQLSAAPLIRLFFEDVVLREPALGELHEAARSASLACAAVEMMQCATRSLVGPNELLLAVRDHIQQHHRVYGSLWWTLKNHLVIHIALDYFRDRELWDTFVTERRHKAAKRFARQALYTKGQSYNKMLMEELICQHFHDWREWRGHDAGVLDPHPPTRRSLEAYRQVFPQAGSIAQSKTYRTEYGALCCTGNVALLGRAHGHACGKIWYHLLVDGVAWTCMEVWPPLDSVGPICKRYRMDTRSCTLLPSLDLRDIVSYRVQGAIALVRVPLYYIYREMRER